jgi:hypothetical protein
MLDPYDDRKLLMETLKPPENYTLDFAVGTTFSLDLLALMRAPVAFTRFEDDCNFGRADLLVLMESLRRYAGRISIFCHAGRIQIPNNYGQHLYSLLEGSVFQALPQNGSGSFHPKVWALRYKSQNGLAAYYRVLCLSRNLTFERSWDTALVLDGFFSERKSAIAANNPLGDFIEFLPGLVAEKLPEETQKRIEQMQYEIRRVKFDPPQDFNKVVFHPLGINNKKTNPLSGRIDRLLVISPFLAEGRLDRLSSLGGKSILISRLDSLQKVSADCLQKFSERFCLKEGAILERDESNDSDESVPYGFGLDLKHNELEQVTIDSRLDGLHAKLYVADAGSEGRIWTGSANATDAAFGKNVEFLVELRGRKKLCGIDAVLNGGHEADDNKGISLRTLLEPVNILDHPLIDENELLKHLADKTRAMLGAAGLSARVSADGKCFCISIEGKIISFPEEVKVAFRPITLHKAQALPFLAGSKLQPVFKGLLCLDISAFFVFDMKVTCGGMSLSEGFVLKLPLHDAPDRRKCIMEKILKDKSQVLRLMMLLLSLERGSDPTGTFPGEWRGRDGGNGQPQLLPGMVPLFESMVRTLNNNPKRIDDLNNLILDLKKNPETNKLLPEGLNEIWEPIWQARMMMKEAGHEEN